MQFATTDRKNLLGLCDIQQQWLDLMSLPEATGVCSGEMPSPYVTFILKKRPANRNDVDPTFKPEDLFVPASDMDVVSISSSRRSDNSWGLLVQVSTPYVDLRSGVLQIGGRAAEISQEWNGLEMPHQRYPEMNEEQSDCGVAAPRAGEVVFVESERWIDIKLGAVILFRIPQNQRHLVVPQVADGVTVEPGQILAKFAGPVTYGRAKLHPNGRQMWNTGESRWMPAKRTLTAVVLQAMRRQLLAGTAAGEFADPAFPVVLAQMELAFKTDPVVVNFVPGFDEVPVIYHRADVLLDVRHLGVREDYNQCRGFYLDLRPVAKYFDAASGMYLLPPVRRDDPASYEISAAGINWSFIPSSRLETATREPSRTVVAV